MRHLILPLGIAVLLGVGARPHARANEPLRFHFETSTMSSDDMGLLDLGVLSAQALRGARRSIVVQEHVTLRLDGGLDAPTTAQLWVAVAIEDPDVEVRVDNILVSSLPTLIDPVHRVGSNVSHEVRITVSDSRHAGALQHEILWSAQID